LQYVPSVVCATVIDKEKPQNVPLTGECLKGLDREPGSFVVTRNNNDNRRHYSTATHAPDSVDNRSLLVILLYRLF
jgi:hypothetical protein